jgi:hypothetical protein
MHVTISSLMLSLVWSEWSECKNCKASKSKQCDCAQIVCIRACGVKLNVRGTAGIAVGAGQVHVEKIVETSAGHQGCR